MSPEAGSFRLPVLLIVAAEDLFEDEAAWLQKIGEVARQATAYPPGSIALQIRPRLTGDPNEGRDDCAHRLRTLLAEVDAAARLPIYASARHPWLQSVAAGWRLHVPETLLHVASPQEHAGELRTWSASVHSPAAAQRAQARGAHLLLVAPVFAPAWKPAEPLGLSGLAAVTGACSVPVLALGGITPERVGVCLEAGAAGVAVASGILRHEDVEAVLGAYAAALGLPALGD